MLRLALPLLALAALCASTAILNDAAVTIRGTGGGTSPPCSIVASVQNGDFETGTLSPWSTLFGTTPPSNATVISPGDGSGYAAQLTVAGYDIRYGGQTTIGQLIPLCTATNYSITFDYNLVNVGSDCLLFVNAQSGFSNYAHVTSSGQLSELGGWATSTFYYPNYVRSEFYITATLQCDTFNDTAVALVDNFQIATLNTLEPADCPGRTIDLSNGGFESGALAPWHFLSPIPQYSIVSPGYNSNYAVQIEIPATNGQNYATLQQRIVGETCLAYNYTLTFAVNWGNYSDISNRTIDDGCRLFMEPDHCSSFTGGGPYHYPEPPNSGWHEITYTCLAGNSESPPLVAQVVCLRLDVSQPTIPPFTLQLDGFTVEPTS